VKAIGEGLSLRGYEQQAMLVKDKIFG